ncbi:MAG: alpha/beta hydrolase [Prevotellaceae bacterium]|jgi:alpha-beta hydrolase superfamily lysophospholipase|nr:alpha/beta hydrolase [Prevotellaceae bacterium]
MNKDILGNGFRQLTIGLKPDCEGEVVCTLIDAGIVQFDRSVLYIHGFSDYFFQTEMATQFRNNRYNFYALDLRKCGRSIRPWQTPCNLYSISDYFEDIDAAITQIRKESPGKLVVVGHSTGGLALAMYLNNRPKIDVSALVLNSPFLDLNISPVLKKVGLPIVSFVAKFFPDIRIKKGLSLNYGYSISKNRHGEWEYNEEWKPLAVSEVRASWLRAIYCAHRELRRGLSIDCPTLVMRSDKSFKSREWTDAFLCSDAVLNVESIRKYAPLLGKNVSEIVVTGGMHDLFLSASEVRETAYRRMFEWLEGVKG